MIGMKMERTEIIFLLDRSGSMAGLESDTIGGLTLFSKNSVDPNGLNLYICYALTESIPNLKEERRF